MSKYGLKQELFKLEKKNFQKLMKRKRDKSWNDFSPLICWPQNKKELTLKKFKEMIKPT